MFFGFWSKFVRHLFGERSVLVRRLSGARLCGFERCHEQDTIPQPCGLGSPNKTGDAAQFFTGTPHVLWALRDDASDPRRVTNCAMPGWALRILNRSRSGNVRMEVLGSSSGALRTETQYLEEFLRVFEKWIQSGSMSPLCIRFLPHTIWKWIQSGYKYPL